MGRLVPEPRGGRGTLLDASSTRLYSGARRAQSRLLVSRFGWGARLWPHYMIYEERPVRRRPQHNYLGRTLPIVGSQTIVQHEYSRFDQIVGSSVEVVPRSDML